MTRTVHTLSVIVEVEAESARDAEHYLAYLAFKDDDDVAVIAAQSFASRQESDDDTQTEPARYTEGRAKDLRVGDTYREDGLDDWETVASIGGHGDTVLVTTTEGIEHGLDIDLGVDIAEVGS